LHAVFVTVVPLIVQAAALLPQATQAVPLIPYPVVEQVIQAVELQTPQLVPQAVQLPEAPVKINPEPQVDKMLKDPPTKQLLEPVMLVEAEQLPYPHCVV